MGRLKDWRREKLIKTLEQFLDAMYSTQYNVDTELRWHKGREAHVTSTHSCGYGSYPTTAKVDDMRVCEEALQKGYIRARNEWGGVSRIVFYLTDEGKNVAHQIRKTDDLVQKPIAVNYDHDGEG